MKSVLWRVVKRLPYIEDARCLKVKEVSCGVFIYPVFSFYTTHHKGRSYCTFTICAKWHGVKPTLRNTCVTLAILQVDVQVVVIHTPNLIQCTSISSYRILV